jgi:hypothetical protein
MWQLPSKLFKALRLDSGPRRRLFLATGTITVIALMLKAFGYSRTIERLSRRVGPEATSIAPEESASTVEKHAWAVRAVGETLPWATCLPRSIALWWLLARRGIETEIQFGVRRGEEDLSAHAWVEWQNESVSDSVDPRTIYTHLNAG